MGSPRKYTGLEEKDSWRVRPPWTIEGLSIVAYKKIIGEVPYFMNVLWW